MRSVVDFQMLISLLRASVAKSFTSSNTFPLTVVVHLLRVFSCMGLVLDGCLFVSEIGGQCGRREEITTDKK